MTNLEALYKAICALPEENTIRLEYADALQESDDKDNHTLAEYIRLLIALEYPPPNSNFASISEWKSRETLGAEMVKRMWEKWSTCECPDCHNDGKLSSPSGRHGEARYYTVADANIPVVCPTCNGAGDILRERITATDAGNLDGIEYNDSFITTTYGIAQRRMTFKRGMLNAVWCQRIEDVWKDGMPTLWAKAIVESTPIDCFMVNDTNPSAIRLQRKKYKYRWFREDEENQLVMGRLPRNIFVMMWDMTFKKRLEAISEPNATLPTEGVIECSSLQEAKELLGCGLGMMLRDSVYGKNVEKVTCSEK